MVLYIPPNRTAIHPLKSLALISSENLSIPSTEHIVVCQRQRGGGRGKGSNLNLQIFIGPHTASSYVLPTNQRINSLVKFKFLESRRTRDRVVELRQDKPRKHEIKIPNRDDAVVWEDVQEEEGGGKV